ncbi:MAG: DASH family cryptochrome [Spirosomataceae bacterium]
MPTTSPILVWFRNDLRVHDHEALFKASQQTTQVVPLYIFDPRWFRSLELGFPKTGLLRTQLLLQSVADLRQRLQQMGSELLIRVGKPEDIIPNLAQHLQAQAVFTSEEVTSEEVNVDSLVETRLQQQGISMQFFWMATLFHHDDLPFDIEQLPDIFTEFRKKTERYAKVRASYPVPTLLPLKVNVEAGPLPQLVDFGFEQTSVSLLYQGGETAALARLEEYFWKKDRLRLYKETRNEMLGLDFSSKFSVWLANGCLSPRYVYEQVKRYEHDRIANDSTYWLIFELLWRDYFRFVALKYGNNLFLPQGIKNDPRIKWQQNTHLFECWQQGHTGVPLIDANMRELAQTGFMSNRGRQNVANFLAKDLHLDWTWGAAWFESQLLDYDVCSNWGNWNYVAGVGNDPRENRYFNSYTQASRYDPAGAYVKHWLPELEPVSAEKIHLTSLLTSQEQQQFGIWLGVHYPKSLVNARKWLKA